MHTRSSLRVVVFAALAACALPLACRSSEQKYASHLDRGLGFENQGKYEEALLEYRNALQIQPSSAEANYRIARTLSEKGKFGDALFFYKEAQRVDPTRSDAALAEAKLVLFQDPARAEELIRNTLEREPDNALAHLRAAELALSKNDTDAALAAVMTAIELDPKDGLYPHNLGVVQQARIRELGTKGQPIPDSLFQAAVDAFQKADQLYGGNVESKLMIARTYLRWNGHEKEVEANLRSAVAYAKEKGSRDEQKKAIRALLDYAALSNNPDLRAWGLEEFVAVDPAAVGAWAELAQEADAQGRSGDAVYQRLLAARPKDVMAYATYAVYLATKGKATEAFAALDDAATKSDDPATALDEKTKLEVQLKQPEQAKATIARLQKEFPDNPRASLAAARLALYENRPADAVSALQRATANSENAEAQLLLSVAELNLGNLEPATAAIDRAISLVPTPMAQMLRQKVAVHAAARDWPAVLQALNKLETATGALAPELRPLLAQGLYETRNPEAGRQVLMRMMTDPATLPTAAVAFAEREGLRDPQTAYTHLEAAQAALPGEPPITAALVHLDLGAHKPDKAMQRLDAALARKEVPALRLLRAQVLASKGDLAGAEADAKRVLEEDPNLPGTADLLVAVYTARGNTDAALRSLESMETAGTLHGGARELLARLYLAHGNEPAARAQFEKALSDTPNLAEAKNGLAFLLASSNTDLDRALTLAQDAQRQLPNAPEVTDTLGYVYLRKGLNEAAIDRFRYALELVPSGATVSPSILYHLGLAYAASGKNQEAMDAFEKALASGTSFPEADAARKELERVRAAGASPSASPS